MIVATIADTLKDLGALCLALGGIIGFFALVSKLRAVRWVGRRLIADPLGGWLRGLVREEIDRKNGGSTLKDTVDRLDEQTRALVKLRDRDHGELVAIKGALGIPDDEEG